MPDRSRASRRLGTAARGTRRPRPATDRDDRADAGRDEERAAGRGSPARSSAAVAGRPAACSSARRAIAPAPAPSEDRQRHRRRSASGRVRIAARRRPRRGRASPIHPDARPPHRGVPDRRPRRPRCTRPIPSSRTCLSLAPNERIAKYLSQVGELSIAPSPTVITGDARGVDPSGDQMRDAEGDPGGDQPDHRPEPPAAGGPWASSMSIPTDGLLSAAQTLHVTVRTEPIRPRPIASAAPAVTTSRITASADAWPIEADARLAEEPRDRHGHRRPVRAGEERGRAELARARRRRRRRRRCGSRRRTPEASRRGSPATATRRARRRSRRALACAAASAGRDDPHDERQGDERLRQRHEPGRAAQIQRRAVEGDHVAEAEGDGRDAERHSDERPDASGPRAERDPDRDAGRRSPARSPRRAPRRAPTSRSRAPAEISNTPPRLPSPMCR